MFGWMTDGTAVEILFGYLTLVTMRRDGPDFRFFFRFTWLDLGCDQISYTGTDEKMNMTSSDLLPSSRHSATVSVVECL
jgi:hypothetical protein